MEFNPAKWILLFQFTFAKKSHLQSNSSDGPQKPNKKIAEILESYLLSCHGEIWIRFLFSMFLKRHVNNFPLTSALCSVCPTKNASCQENIPPSYLSRGSLSTVILTKPYVLEIRFSSSVLLYLFTGKYVERRLGQYGRQL